MLAAATMTAGGCAHGAQTVERDGFAEPETTVKVTSYNWSDINVYLVRGSWRQRLGTISSFSTRTFDLPDHLLAGASKVYLHADLIGSSRTHTSPPLLVMRGHQVEWRLENNLQLSSAYVR
jgi:hypothetical protein